MHRTKSLTHTLPIVAALQAFATCSAAQDVVESPAAVISGSCAQLPFDRRFLVVPASVDVLVHVNDQGVATTAKATVEPQNAELVEAAQSAAMSCKFKAATSKTGSVPGTTRLVYTVSPDRFALSPSNMDSALGIRPAIADVRSCAPTADDYPPESRRLNESGTTRISFTVGPQGQLLAFGVAQSSGFLRLDFTALIKLTTCKFKPGRNADGTPAGGTFTVDYVWRLE